MENLVKSSVHGQESVTPGLKVLDWNTCKREWPHLRSTDFPEVSYHDVVDILIGIDAIHLHSAMEEIYGEPGEPVARCTPLGWTCIGSPEKCLSSELSCYVQLFHVHTTADLDYALRKFWEFEAIGMNNDNNEVYTPAEKDAMAKVAASQCYLDGCYEVGIPWIQEEITLENNCVLAQKRLENLERSLQHRPEFARKCNEVLHLT